MDLDLSSAEILARHSVCTLAQQLACGRNIAVYYMDGCVDLCRYVPYCHPLCFTNICQIAGDRLRGWGYRASRIEVATTAETRMELRGDPRRWARFTADTGQTAHELAVVYNTSIGEHSTRLLWCVATLPGSRVPDDESGSDSDMETGV